MLALLTKVGEKVAFRAKWLVLAKDAKRPRTPGRVLAFANVSQLFKLNLSLSELIEISVRSIDHLLLAWDFLTPRFIAPFVDLGQIVNPVQVVVCLDLEIVFEVVPREDHIEVVPEVPGLLRVRPVEDWELFPSGKVSRVSAPSVVNNWVLAKLLHIIPLFVFVPVVEGW